MRLEFHLPQTEFCMQVALYKICVLIIFCKYMGDKPLIEIHIYFPFQLWENQFMTVIDIIRLCVLPEAMLGAQEVTRHRCVPRAGRPLPVEGPYQCQCTYS